MWYWIIFGILLLWWILRPTKEFKQALRDTVDEEERNANGTRP